MLPQYKAPTHRGRLIALEGIDGTGKTTHVDAIYRHLTKQGMKVLCLREPGGTSVGEKIRAILLNDAPVPQAELLLFAAARVHILQTTVRPALESGYVVVLDRYMDSTYAYQAHGRNLPGEVDMVENLWVNDQPDYNLYFTVTLETAKQRTAARRGQVLDRLDKEGDDFRQRLSHGYDQRMRQRVGSGHKVHVVNAELPIDQVEAGILAWLDSNFIPENQHLVIGG